MLRCRGGLEVSLQDGAGGWPLAEVGLDANRDGSGNGVVTGRARREREDADPADDELVDTRSDAAVTAPDALRANPITVTAAGPPTLVSAASSLKDPSVPCNASSLSELNFRSSAKSLKNN